MIEWSGSEHTDGIYHGRGNGPYPYIITEVKTETGTDYRVGCIIKESFQPLGTGSTLTYAKLVAEMHDKVE